jgi:hypothetical protein
MTQLIQKIAVLRKLETIENAVATGKRSSAALVRRDLALLFDFKVADPLSVAVNKVLQLSAKWARGSLDVEPAEIKTAVEKAIALLRS